MKKALLPLALTALFALPAHAGEAESLDTLRQTTMNLIDALAVFECGADETPATPGFSTLDERLYGAAKVLFLRADAA